MHPKSNASQIAGQPAMDLVLERLPNGELAWLRSSPDPQTDEEPRYVLTDAGRRALRASDVFGPWPTVAQLYRQFTATYGSDGGTSAA